MPSAGGTIPVEATPRFFEQLADVEPSRQGYPAVRALMFFDGNAAAGPSQGLRMTVAGLARGLGSGVLITWYYDKKGLTRSSRTKAPTVRPRADRPAGPPPPPA